MACAVEKRLLEFTSDGLADRQAMTKLNHHPAAIPMALDSSPVWLDGLEGSVTHSDDICITAMVQSGTGRRIGIEPETPLDSDLEEVICTLSERDWLETQPSDQRGHLAKGNFYMKESIYKALYPLTGQMIGFDEVEIEFSSSHITLADQVADLRAETGLATLGSSMLAFTYVSEAPFPTTQSNRSE